MLQTWHIRSRANECALTGRPFDEGETFYTAIYFNPELNGYERRDVALDAWEQELAERTPFSYWKAVYEKVVVEEKPEITPKESALALLNRFIEEDDPKTENARYILTLMLERKKQLTPTSEKESEQGKMLFYENKKTGEVFIIRDPELRLDELEQVQDEVAALLAFGGPAAAAAKAVGMSFDADGKLQTGQSEESRSEETPATTGEGRCEQDGDSEEPENDGNEANHADAADKPEEEPRTSDDLGHSMDEHADDSTRAGDATDDAPDKA